MMQSGQDLCGDDGPRSLDGSSSRRRPCSTPGAYASHRSRANKKSGPVVNAVRRRSGHVLVRDNDGAYGQAFTSRVRARSTYWFCHGDLGDVGRSRLSGPLARRDCCRSGRRAVFHGNASTICCASHSRGRMPGHRKPEQLSTSRDPPRQTQTGNSNVRVASARREGCSVCGADR